MKPFIYFFIFSSTVLFFGSCSKSNSSPAAPKVAVVTTLAGNGSNGFADGTGKAAEFNHPYGVALDGSGNLYVGDEGNNIIREITPGGAVTTFAGSISNLPGHADGTGSAAQFFSPDGIAVDASGNVYVADEVNNLIRKITSSGTVTTLAGGSEGYLDGTGTAAEFHGPSSIAVDHSGNLYVADTYNQRVRKITPTGVVTTLAGSGGTGPGNGGYTDGPGTTAQFQNPQGVAIDAAGNVYVADRNNNLIRKIAPSGIVSTIAGDGTTGEQDGTGIAAEFGSPNGLVVDPSGNIYVVDALNTVRKITPGGVVTTIAGNATLGYSDGTGVAAQFNGPTSIAIDASGNLYVADYGNGVIRKITFK